MSRLKMVSAVAVVLAGAALTGCEFAGLEPGAAEDLQSEVAAVTQAAEAGRYQEALRDLDDLTVRLEAATRQGDVSLSREERISAAIDAVRLSLETELALQK